MRNNKRIAPSTAQKDGGNEQSQTSDRSEGKIKTERQLQ